VVVVLQPRPDSMALATEVKDELGDLCDHVLNGKGDPANESTARG
jgi:hypothetical protein